MCVCVVCVLASAVRSRGLGETRPLRKKEEEEGGRASRQRAVVRPVAVGRCVGARRVGDDATRRDDDGPPLLLLAALPLGALDVLDRLQEVMGGKQSGISVQQHHLVFKVTDQPPSFVSL